MNIKTVKKNDAVCAVITGEGIIISDARDALDVLVSAEYEAGTKNIAIAKEHIAGDFFVLRTGLAGEILQKFINYGGRIAIYGDHTRYQSKPLNDFIYESNKGKDVFFAASEEEAINRLTR